MAGHPLALKHPLTFDDQDGSHYNG
jgi:hypothetical protein